jgi:hypothetical protein
MMSDQQPRQRHYLERVSSAPGGQMVAAAAVQADGTVEYFASAEAALQAAAKRGGRAAGFRAMSEFIDEASKPTTIMLRGDFVPLVLS